MKRIIFSLVALAGMLSAKAQLPTDTFIKIEEHNLYSQCFADLDKDGDGIVTYADAAAATMLNLEKGGRSNIIEDYAFLKYFPNLTALAVGNTTKEVIDLHYQTKLEHLGVMSALWLEEVIISAKAAEPQIEGKEGVKIERCNLVPFADEGVKAFCLRSKIDKDEDGEISFDEAEAVKNLSLMSFKSFIKFIKSYEDLKYFPNLENFDAGTTYQETVDVSCLPKLKELNLGDCRMLKTIVLAKGCKPEIKYPVAYKGEQAKIVYK